MSRFGINGLVLPRAQVIAPGETYDFEYSSLGVNRPLALCLVFLFVFPTCPPVSLMSRSRRARTFSMPSPSAGLAAPGIASNGPSVPILLKEQTERLS